MIILVFPDDCSPIINTFGVWISTSGKAFTSNSGKVDFILLAEDETSCEDGTTESADLERAIWSTSIKEELDAFWSETVELSSVCESSSAVAGLNNLNNPNIIFGDESTNQQVEI